MQEPKPVRSSVRKEGNVIAGRAPCQKQPLGDAARNKEGRKREATAIAMAIATMKRQIAAKSACEQRQERLCVKRLQEASQQLQQSRSNESTRTAAYSFRSLGAEGLQRSLSRARCDLSEIETAKSRSAKNDTGCRDVAAQTVRLMRRAAVQRRGPGSDIHAGLAATWPM